MADLSFVRKFPGKCHAEVSRKGEAQPCDKPAVAVKVDEYYGERPYPVCAYHARGALVPLAELLGGTDG